MSFTLADLEAVFAAAEQEGAAYVGVRIEMDDFPSDEVIINPAQNIAQKLSYYKQVYGESCAHRHAPGIRIVGAAYGNGFCRIQKQLYAINQASCS